MLRKTLELHLNYYFVLFLTGHVTICCLFIHNRFSAHAHIKWRNFLLGVTSLLYVFDCDISIIYQDIEKRIILPGKLITSHCVIYYSLMLAENILLVNGFFHEELGGVINCDVQMFATTGVMAATFYGMVAMLTYKALPHLP